MKSNKNSIQDRLRNHRLFVALSAVVVALTWSATPRSAHAYVPKEHKKIGDLGAQMAFRAFARRLDLPIRGKDGKILVSKSGKVWVGKGRQGVWATMGDLTAIYGDFRDSVPALLSTDAKRLSFLLKLVLSHKIKHPLVFLKEAVKVASLAFRNASHFSSVAIRTYFTHHKKALSLAGEAARTGDGRKLWLALHHEGLGFHSLTDIFIHR